MSNTQSQTVNITLPKALLKQIDALAKRDYTSRSDIIRQTMLQRIRASAHLQKRTDLDEWGGKRISDKKLMEDIDFNVHTSMKLLRYLYDKYGDWKIVFGCYNTGSPLVNQYALDVYDFNFQPNGYKLK
jgi:Arc/MetJ-type ribon-helix-helix transcriptional regulator